MTDIPKVPPPPSDVHGVSGVTDAAIVPADALDDPTRVTWENYCPAGVYGQTTNEGFGVIGIDNPDSDGLWGYIAGITVAKRGAIGGITVAKTGGIAVYGDAQLAGSPSWAGVFNGDVGVIGGISARGDVQFLGTLFAGTLLARTKNAIVPFPDGSNRLLHCMESPEHWFEDFGSARLTRGRATVKLDADFAKVVTLNGYRVFLTPEGDCHGLYVRNKRGSSFEVRELQGGTSNVAFSYRIVAKRKDIKRHTRFAKIDITTPMLKGPARAGRGRKTARWPASRLVAALAKDARKKAT